MVEYRGDVLELFLGWISAPPWAAWTAPRPTQSQKFRHISNAVPHSVGGDACGCCDGLARLTANPAPHEPIDMVRKAVLL